jgi:hypothetical protein
MGVDKAVLLKDDSDRDSFGVAKGLVEELLHYSIADGVVQGYNGRISLRSPIETDLNIRPNGLQFMRALAASTETVALSVTDSNRVAVKSGTFRAYIPQSENPFPTVLPQGDIVPIKKLDLVAVMKKLLPFTAEDASRPWAMGILFKNGKAYATNNVLIVEHALGVKFPAEIIIPKQTAREMVRLRENPTHMQVGASNVTFHYEGERWMCSNMLGGQWPDINSVLSPVNWGAVPTTPDNFFEALDTLRPFIDEFERVFIQHDRLATSTSDTEGAAVDIPMPDHPGIFNLLQLMNLRDLITGIDLSYYPKPCPFSGPKIRGVIVGMRG